MLASLFLQHTVVPKHTEGLLDAMALYTQRHAEGFLSGPAGTQIQARAGAQGGEQGEGF